MKYIFIDNKDNLNDEFYYSEIAKAVGDDKDIEKQKNWSKYRTALKDLNSKICDDFFIYNSSKEGYVKIDKPLPVDNKVPKSLGNQYIWINYNALATSSVSGIVGKANMVSKGADIVDVLKGKGEKGTKAYGKANKIANNMHKQVLTEMVELYNGNIDTDYTETYMVPTVDKHGAAQGYRYVMSEHAKNNLLGKQDEFHKVLGSMSASILDKVSSVKFGTDVINQAKSEYDSTYENNKREFTYIGKDAKDKINVERWAMLPTQARHNLEEIWGKEGMFIRTELLDITFGYKKFSLGNLPILQGTLFGNGVKIAELIWQEIVKLAKNKIVILMPDVLRGNVNSNNLILYAEGIPVKDIYDNSKIAVRAIIDHREASFKLDKLKVKRDALKGKLTPTQAKNYDRKIAMLQRELDESPIAKLIEEGVFQSLVEDIDVEDTSFTKSKLAQSKYGKKAVKMWEKDGTLVKGYKQLTVHPTTETYASLLKATQYSDLVARYVMYMDKVGRQGKSHDKAINDIMEAFINYDIPQSRELQYLNDMGLLMFTKFWFRIQRMIFRYWAKQPATMMAIEASQRLLGEDVADITDSALNPLDAWGKLKLNPMEHVDDAFELSLLNLATYPF